MFKLYNQGDKQVTVVVHFVKVAETVLIHLKENYFYSVLNNHLGPVVQSIISVTSSLRTLDHFITKYTDIFC